MAIHSATLALSVIVAPTSSQFPPAVPADPPTVAVLAFDFAAVRQWWANEFDLGRGIADLITDGVVNDGAYRIVERRFLKPIMQEQELAADQQNSDPSAANLVRAGKLLGAQYLVVGAVTHFGIENESKGGGIALFRVLGGGVINRTKGKAAVTITARLVDATSGVVVASVRGDGVSSRKGLMLGALGPGGFGGLSMRSTEFRETILGEATDAAVRQVIARLVAAKARIPHQP